MNSTLTKIQAIWVAIGSFLAVIGATSKFTWLGDIFSQTFVDTTLVAVAAVIAYAQYVRNIFAKKVLQIKTLSKSAKIWYFVNPFKLEA